MKKRINNKTYNTETATLLGVVYNQGMQGYNGTYNTKYYLTKRGLYFEVYNGKIYSEKDIIRYLETAKEEYPVFLNEVPTGGWETRPFMVIYQ